MVRVLNVNRAGSTMTAQVLWETDRMASQTPRVWARDFSPTAKKSTAPRILVVDEMT